MRDIKLTLSEDETRRSPTVEDEADWLNLEKKIFYPLSGRSKEAQAGCCIYFIRAGQLVARAKSDEFRHLPTGEHLESYTGVSEAKGGWHVLCSSMELLTQAQAIAARAAILSGIPLCNTNRASQFRASVQVVMHP